MQQDRTVIVAGATGFIGKAVTRQLLAAGWRVIALSTDPARARQVLPMISGWIGYDGTALEEAVAEHGKVIRLAGQNPLNHRWTAAYKSKMWASRVDNCLRLSRALATSPARDRVLVTASAINIHAAAGDAMVAETSAGGTNWVAKMLAAMEASLEPARAGGARTASLRIGLALGPCGGPLEFIEKPFLMHMGGHAGSGAQFVPWIHVEDLASMFVEALENSAWEGPYIAAAPVPERARDMAKMIGRQLGRASWLHVPGPLAQVMMGEVATLVTSSYRTDPSRAIGHGFRFRWTDLAAALADIHAQEQLGGNLVRPSGVLAE